MIVLNTLKILEIKVAQRDSLLAPSDSRTILKLNNKVYCIKKGTSISTKILAVIRI